MRLCYQEKTSFLYFLPQDGDFLICKLTKKNWHFSICNANVI